MPDIQALQYRRYRKMSLFRTVKRKKGEVAFQHEDYSRKEKVSTLIIGKPQMSLSIFEGSDLNGEFSTTYQQEKTTESQTKDQWSSQVSVFENALLGCPKRVEYGKCLKRIWKFKILKPQKLLVRETWRTCDERDNNENLSSFDTTNFSSFICARLLASTCSAFHIKLFRRKKMSFWQFQGKPNIYKKNIKWIARSK